MGIVLTDLLVEDLCDLMCGEPETEDEEWEDVEEVRVCGEVC